MENEGYETIDLLEVLNAVRQHLLAVILATVILAAAGFGVSKFLITPQYEASALMIVNTRHPSGHHLQRHQRPDQLRHQAGFHLQHHHQERHRTAAGH